jgi:hypothetical protein
MSQSPRVLVSSLFILGLAASSGSIRMAAPNPPATSFGADLAFLKQHTSVITLADETGRAQVVVAPAWQGRVVTSTAGGSDGPSFGWINRELIASRTLQPHINVFGGEDRFWLGPEGGQFSIFFAKGAKFDLEHWFTPPPIDTDAYQVVRQSRDSAQFRHDLQLTNYSGTTFSVRADRDVRLLAPAAAWKQLGLDP